MGFGGLRLQQQCVCVSVMRTLSDAPGVLPAAHALAVGLDDGVGAHHGEGHARAQPAGRLRRLALLARALREVVDLDLMLTYFFHYLSITLYYGVIFILQTLDIEIVAKSAFTLDEINATIKITRRDAVMW